MLLPYKDLLKTKNILLGSSILILNLVSLAIILIINLLLIIIKKVQEEKT